MIALSAGRDCTDLIRSYHPFNDKPYTVLEKLKVGAKRTGFAASTRLVPSSQCHDNSGLLDVNNISCVPVVH